jgi:hypothetical protein
MTRFVAITLACLALATITTGALAPAPAGARPAGAADAIIEAKLKCRLTDDGRFVCENTKNKNNKCSGPNDCGPGYRDLEKPSNHGACCEEIKDAPKKDGKPNEDVPEKEETEPPKSGGCRQVGNSAEMNCKAPFDAMSCGALENGKMTCCCVK